MLGDQLPTRPAFSFADTMPLTAEQIKAKAKKLAAQKKAEATDASAVAQLSRPGSKKLESRESNDASFTAVGAAGGGIEVIIILEGPGNDADKHWYSAQAIQDGVIKFNGQRAFLNHQTAEEAEDRPEQDVTLLAGFYKNTRVGTAYNWKLGKNVSALQATFVSNGTEAGQEAAALARAQILWQESFPNLKGECHAAISINSGGWSDGTVEYNGEEWTNVVAFEDVRSADIVTRPGAGGAFVRLAESLTGVPVKTKESDMKKELLKLAVALETATKAVKAEKDSKKRTALESDRKKAQAAFNALMVKVTEAEKVKEGEEEGEAKEAEGEEEEGEDEGADPAAHMAALKAHVPQHDDENDQQYADRLTAIVGHAGAASAPAGEPDGDEAEGEEEAEDGEGEGLPPMPPKKAEKSKESRHRESAAVRQFRKESPRLYAEVMTNMRETLGAERRDFKSVKTRLEALESENRSLRLERDLGVCEKMLTEAGIPHKYLAAGDLLKLDEAGRKREISRTKLIMEGAGSTRVYDGSNGIEQDGESADWSGIGTPKA